MINTGLFTQSLDGADPASCGLGSSRSILELAGRLISSPLGAQLRDLVQDGWDVKTLAKVAAALALMATLIWLYVDPGWDPVAAGLGALAALLILFVSDRNRAGGGHPEASEVPQNDLGQLDISAVVTLTGEVTVHSTREEV